MVLATIFLKDVPLLRNITKLNFVGAFSPSKNGFGFGKCGVGF
jgi:hypothetical protein